MRHAGSEELSRTLGWSSEAEIRASLDSTVAVGGVGAAGFPMALALARDGVSHFKVADPDVIERSNFNRHPGAFRSTVGKRKVDVLRDMILDINEDAIVETYIEGVTADNVNEFVRGADLVFDGIDFNVPHISVMLHRAAMMAGTVSMTGLELGSCAVYTSFNAATVPFEETIGFSRHDSIASIQAQVAEGLDVAGSIPYMPFKSAHMNVLKAVVKGAPVPSNARGVMLFGAAVAEEALLHLTSHVQNEQNVLQKLLTAGKVGNNRPAPIWAPRYQVYDLTRRKSPTIRKTAIGSSGRLLLMAARSKMGLNPVLSYDVN